MKRERQAAICDIVNSKKARTQEDITRLLSEAGYNVTQATVSRDLKELGFIKEIEYRYRSTNFAHIFGGGYEVGYYSYLWAEVLDCDAFELFLKEGIFDTETAASFKQLLEMGGSKDPMREYRRFRGADPDPAALLRTRGLI